MCLWQACQSWFRAGMKSRAAYLDVLLKILRPLEGLATELALVRLERNVNANVRSDVITFDSGSAA